MGRGDGPGVGAVGMMFSRLRDWAGRGATGAAGRRALAQAQAAVRSRDLNAARAHLERAAQASPEDAAVLADCGRLLAGAGLVAERFGSSRGRTPCAPQDAALALELGDALRASGQAHEARALAEAVLAREPEHAGALLSLGHAHLSGGALEAARGVFERLAVSAPADPSPGHGLALALHAQGRTDEARAVGFDAPARGESRLRARAGARGRAGAGARRGGRSGRTGWSARPTGRRTTPACKATSGSRICAPDAPRRRSRRCSSPSTIGLSWRPRT